MPLRVRLSDWLGIGLLTKYEATYGARDRDHNATTRRKYVQRHVTAAQPINDRIDTKQDATNAQSHTDKVELPRRCLRRLWMRPTEYGTCSNLL